jgi:galactokinase
VSVPEVDTLVSIAATTPGVLGARLTGGGFGGAIVMVTEATRGAAAARSVVDAAVAAGIGARWLGLLEGEPKEPRT